MFNLKGGIMGLVGLVGLLLLVLVLACAAPTEKAATPTAAAKEAETAPAGQTQTYAKGVVLKLEEVPYEPEGKAGGILVQGSNIDPAMWDPHMTRSEQLHYATNLYHEKLVTYGYGPANGGYDFTPRPELAESWEISADGKTYTFHLRKGVKFHNIPPVNGREWTAQDAKWSLERQRDTLGSPVAWKLPVIESIDCPDKYTLVIHLSEARSGFLSAMADAYTSVTLAAECQKGRQDLNDWRLASIGTGPWMLEDYKGSVHMVFKKNPDYWKEGLPYLDGIKRLSVPDSSTQLAAFRAGRIDIRAISRLDLDSVWNTNPDMKCHLTATSYYWPFGLHMRSDQAPFNDVRVRQAISMALNRQLWVDSVCFGYGKPQETLIPPDSEWYLPLDKMGEKAKYHEYNPEAAKRLLAEAGYPQGFKTSMVVPTTWTMDNAELWVDMLSEIGIKVEIKPQEYAAWFASTYTGKYDQMTQGPFHGAVSDPDDIYLNLMVPSAITNQSHVDDPKLTEMVLAQSRALSPEERLKMLYDIQYYLADKIYEVAQPKCDTITCAQPWVHNFKTHTDLYNLGGWYEAVWFDERAPKR